jgi:hypothetical protein
MRAHHAFIAIHSRHVRLLEEEHQNQRCFLISSRYAVQFPFSFGAHETIENLKIKCECNFLCEIDATKKWMMNEHKFSVLANDLIQVKSSAKLGVWAYSNILSKGLEIVTFMGESSNWKGSQTAGNLFNF